MLLNEHRIIPVFEIDFVYYSIPPVPHQARHRYAMQPFSGLPC